MKKGHIVCLTGIDGSGKTTLTSSAKEELSRSGRTVCYLWCGWRGFRFLPFKLAISLAKTIAAHKNVEKTADIGSSNPDQASSGLLFTAARIDYLLSVFPQVFLSRYRYDVVILDRYIYDVAVGFAEAGGNDDIRHNLRYFRFYPRPDRVFYIDVPIEVAFSRKDDIPSVEYLRKKRELYLKTMGLLGDQAQILDGTRSREDLAREFLSAVDGLP